MKDEKFDALLKSAEKPVWEVFKVVGGNFHGKHKAPNSRKLVENIPETIRNVGCNMSLKLHLTYSHLNLFYKQHCRCWWQAWQEISPSYLFHRKMLQMEVELRNAWLLLLETWKTNSSCMQKGKKA
jgi:hypothetical protein